jgi:hypothetical protein
VRLNENGDNAGLKLLEIDVDGDSSADMSIQFNANLDVHNFDVTDIKHD